jgi:Tol biopolymer transport system component
VNVPLLLDGDRLGVSALDGAAPTAITSAGSYSVAEPDRSPLNGPTNVAGFIWSPDSSRLMAWSGDRKAVSIVDASSGAITPTTAPAPASWSAAGDVAAVEWSSSTGFIGTVVLAHEDGRARYTVGSVHIPTEAAPPQPIFSPDGRWLAWVGTNAGPNGKERLAVTDVRTASLITPSCAACTTDVPGGDPIWSPDGRSLAWTQGDQVVVARTGIWIGDRR